MANRDNYVQKLEKCELSNKHVIHVCEEYLLQVKNENELDDMDMKLQADIKRGGVKEFTVAGMPYIFIQLTTTKLILF